MNVMENLLEEFAPEETKYLHLQDLLSKGDDIQKLSIIQALPQLVRIDQQATFSRIVPKIQQELPKASSEFQVTTSQIFRVLIEKELPVNLLGAVIQGVDSRDPVVSAAWMDTLLSVIPLLHENVIKNEIIPLIVIKSQLSQPVIQRVAGCRIIGKIANHKSLKPTDVKKDILPFVHSLSQDCSVEVRAVMCMQLPYVAEGIGTSIVRTQLMPCFVELASDNAPLVREAAVLTLVNLFPYIEKDLIQSTVIPLIKKLCEKSVPEDNIASIVASQYGAILEHIMPSLNHDDRNWFLTYYKVLAKTGFETRPGGIQTSDASRDVVCRENCAANLPAVAKFVAVWMPQSMDILYSIFRDLAGDPCYIVRRAVAGCIHEVAKILGPQNRMLKADFVRLLRDDAEDVLQMLVPNLKSTLTLLAQFGFLSKDRTDQTTMEISRAVLKCQIELAKGYNWRLLATFIEQLESLPLCMPCDFIHQHFTPIVLGNAANGRVKPVRYQAVKTLLIFLRENKKDNQQKWLRDALINQFCYSDSCYTRQIYVKMCFYALDIFSSRYFKEYFFQPLLTLSEDPVSNVRYSFIGILPHLKLLTLLPPVDSKYKVLLQDAITKLETKEKEKYVIQHFKATLREVQAVSLIGDKEYQTRDLAKQEHEALLNGPAPEKQIATITAHQPAKGKGTAPSVVTSGRPMPRAPPRSANQSKTGTPASTPSPSAVSTGVDMNFLEQHFYTDAGVNLPADKLSITGDHENGALEGTNDKGDTILRPAPPTHLLNDDFADDTTRTDTLVVDKANDIRTNQIRRRIGKTANGADNPDNVRFRHKHQRSTTSIKAKKRHSSILNATAPAATPSGYLSSSNNNNNNNNRILQKRYSLNIGSSVAWQRDFDSRIPVCIRKYRTNNSNAADCDDTDTTTTSEPHTKQHGPLCEITAQMSNLNVATVGRSNDPPQENKVAKTSSLPLAIRKSAK